MRGVASCAPASSHPPGPEAPLITRAILWNSFLAWFAFCAVSATFLVSPNGDSAAGMNSVYQYIGIVSKVSMVGKVGKAGEFSHSV